VLIWKRANDGEERGGGIEKREEREKAPKWAKVCCHGEIQLK